MEILIWDLNIPLSNTGGPSGYLYSIHEYLKSNPHTGITFISDLQDKAGKSNKLSNKQTKKLPQLLNIIYRKFAKYRYFYMDYRSLLHGEDVIDENLLNKIMSFDAIHFHTSIDLHKARRILKGYNGKVILTSHSPQPLSDELIERIGVKEPIQGILKRRLYHAEIQSWSLCDAMIFPVQGALEPYKKVPVFRQFIEKLNKNIYYCPSSINKEYTLKQIDIRSTLNIPDDAYIISYLGRHNHIKGYDELKKFGEAILKIYPDIYFVIGGRENPLKGINHPHWIELGWCNYGNDLLLASDLFILPNAETYFDLITLEVLRIGTPILMSRTGGNKYFDNDFMKSSGIHLYEYGNLEDQINKFDKILEKLRSGDKDRMRLDNRGIFHKYFTSSSFMCRYVETLRSIISIRS